MGAMIEFQAITEEEQKKSKEKDIICKKHHMAEDARDAVAKDLEAQTSVVDKKRSLLHKAEDELAALRQRADAARRLLDRAQKKENAAIAEVHSAKEHSLEAADDAERLRVAWAH